MRDLFRKPQYRLALKATLGSLLLLPQSVGFSSPAKNSLESPSEKEGTRMHFPNVAMSEFVRHISKSYGLNFVFDPDDLNFSISILADAVQTRENVVSILTQILQIHGFTLVEDGLTTIITKNPSVKSLAHIVQKNGEHVLSPLITRIFYLKNSDPVTLAGIIKPMLSSFAGVSPSIETSQLIVTDVSSNVERVRELVDALDSPQSPLEIAIYETTTASPKELTALSSDIIAPLKGKTALILVPHEETNRIFIVSTPYLNEKMKSILTNLDKPEIDRSERKVSLDNLSVYKAQNKTPYELLSALQEVADSLKQEKTPPTAMIQAIQKTKEITSSNSLFTVTDPDTAKKIHDILTAIDQVEVPGTPQEEKSFRVYKIKAEDERKIKSTMERIAEHMGDSALKNAIEHMHYQKETSSLLVTGKLKTLEKIDAMMAPFAKGASGDSDHKVDIFPVKNVPSVEMKLRTLIQTLSTSKSDLAFVEVLKNAQAVPGTNLFKLSGPEELTTRAHKILTQLDDIGTVSADGKIEVVPLKQASAAKVIEHLQKLSQKLQGTPVGAALTQITITPGLNALTISGPEDVRNEVKTLLDQYDTQSQVGPTEEAIVTIDNVTAEKFLALNTALTHSKGLGKLNVCAHHIASFNKLILTGSAKGVKLVQEILAANTAGTDEGPIAVYSYRPCSKTIEDAQKHTATILKQLSSLQAAEGTKQALANGHWDMESKQFTAIGSQKAIDQIRTLFDRFDSQESCNPSLPQTDARFSEYVTYKIRGKQDASSLIKSSQDFIAKLTSMGIDKPDLFKSITHMRADTAGIIIPGPTAVTTEITQMLAGIDMPTDSPTSFVGDAVMQCNVYKLQYHQGSEILDSLKKIGEELSKVNKGSNTDIIAAINSLQWIQSTNSLIAFEKKEVVDKLGDLIRQLDTPIKQVFIEVLVIETSLGNNQAFGLEWGSKGQYKNRVGFGTGNFQPADSSGNKGTLKTPLTGISNTATPTGASIPFSDSFNLGVIGDIIFHKGKSFMSLGALVTALQSDLDSTIVLNPKIVTQDNRNSTIFVGQNIPFTGSVITSTVTGGANTSTSVEYRDIGVNLSITPMVGDDDIITLDIINDISEEVSSGSSTNSSSTTPTGIATTHTSMNTRVTVPDRHFLILSGMIRDTKVNEKTGIPCLGGIPYLGAAFSKTGRSANKTNVVIFIRPHIIHNPKEHVELTTRQEEVYKDSATLPVLKQWFDAGLEMVKTTDNE